MDEWMDGMCCPKVRKLCFLGGTVPQVCWASVLAGPGPTVLCGCDYDRQVSCQQEQASDDSIRQYHNSAK